MTCARSCFLAGGKCIGVMGTAIDADKALYRDVVARGALISEYPPGMENRKHFFRDRNRIAAALCHGVVVIEAPEKSGTLLFAARALEQGREVFAVPGNADSFNSVGTNGLIKQGAKPVTRGWDVTGEREAGSVRWRCTAEGRCPGECPSGGRFRQRHSRYP